MVPLRRWRPLLLVAVVWLAASWYFLRGDSDGRPMHQTSPQGPHSGRPDGKKQQPVDDTVRWTKLPEQFPVPSLRSLPAAPTTTTTAPAAVKESFAHSWRGYRTHAWLHDEVAPISGAAQDPFGGWAATLVDSLDALWILGMRSEFERAVRAVGRIDFARTHRAGGADGKAVVNVFETTIRYLGGLLAAYELAGSRHAVLLAKAVEVGDLLMCAFDTPNRMPATRWDLGAYGTGEPQKAGRAVVAAELGSLGLEFTKLSQLTGDARYYDAVQRVADELERGQADTRLPGMWPATVDAARLRFDVDRTFTLGGGADSMYEYLPKQFLLLGGALEQPRRMYESALDVARRHLLRRVLNEGDARLVAAGDARVVGGFGGREATVEFVARSQHLTCFAGGMVGIASRAFARPADLDLALQLTEACVWSYRSTASGVGPEAFSFVPCGGIDESQTGAACAWSRDRWYAALAEQLRVSRDDPFKEEIVQTHINKRRLSPGMTEIDDRKYILRPEAIESVFIMYRLTGDPAWMDKAWEMFEAIEKHTRTDIAAASLDDVTRKDPHKVDNMESFWLAETLKYFYLIFSEFDVVNLDEWVLNTEAHPLRRADA